MVEEVIANRNRTTPEEAPAKDEIWIKSGWAGPGKNDTAKRAKADKQLIE